MVFASELAGGLVSFVQNDRRLAETDQVAERSFNQSFVLPVVIPQHVQIRELSLQRLVLFRIILGRKMLDDIAAAIAEELELLLRLAVGAGEFQNQNVQVAVQLARRQAKDLMLFPHLNAP